MIFEWCTNGLEDLRMAQEMGVRRIELCGALEVGGLTPTLSVIRRTRAIFNGSIYMMVRPRPGGFEYDSREIQLMEADIITAADNGVDGVVFGCLRDGEYHMEANGKLLEIARESGLRCTFHRAVDVAKNPVDIAKSAANQGFGYLLTSGGKPIALDGKENIMRMVEITAGSGMKIIAGSGVYGGNANELLKSGVHGLHMTSRKQKERPDPFQMGTEYELDEVKLKSMLDALEIWSSH